MMETLKSTNDPNDHIYYNFNLHDVIVGQLQESPQSSPAYGQTVGREQELLTVSLSCEQANLIDI